MDIKLEELGLAYRRAKADLYYTRNANSVKLVRYEKALFENLSRLHKSLRREAFAEIISSYCHGWRLVPKDVSFVDENDESVAHSEVRLSDSAHQVSGCTLRLIEDAPIDFHVITQLWIDRVAQRFEIRMSENSYGYRLRMHRGVVNLRYPGSFRYWMRRYQDWHDGGLDKIEQALRQGKNVVALTTDVSAFYHGLSPRFLLDDKYLSNLGVHIEGDDLVLTELVVQMLEAWARGTPINRGLPVGCSVSAVIANLALTLLDRKIEALPDLVFYGRYVDDIILAFENRGGFRTLDETLAYICEKIPDMVNCGTEICYCPSDFNIGPARVCFNRDKTRAFIFDSSDGLGFVDGLRTQIKKRSSEWRALPDLPDNANDLVRSIIAITDRHGLEVGKLRQAEEVSIRRAAFAMKLADFDDYASCLNPDDWRSQREAFLETVSKYFTNTKSYFELYKYFPRLVAIASHGLASDDQGCCKILDEIFHRIAKSIDKALCGDIYIAGLEGARQDVSNVKDQLLFQVSRGLGEAIATSVSDSNVRKHVNECLIKAFPSCAGILPDLPKHEEFLLSDLAWEPFKVLMFSVHDMKPRKVNRKEHKHSNLVGILPREYLSNAIRVLQDNEDWRAMLDGKTPPSGFVFPTRKMSEMELYAIMREPYHALLGGREVIAEYLRLQGYGVAMDNMIAIRRDRRKSVRIDIPDRAPDADSHKFGDRKIALTYWRSSFKDWVSQINGASAVTGHPERFSRVMRLANQILRSHERPDYVLFHELALPWRWFLLMARKLDRSQISLLAGVEYLRSPRNTLMVRNEAWCALRSYASGYPGQALVRILKTHPAEDEKIGLSEYNLKLDTLATAGTFRSGDVIVHGTGAAGLFFSVVICSDLTDINMRARLRGQVDLLNVLAWNLDIKTFNALVTASAYDLHAYVAMANNGEYGDTRIRAPYMIDYDRDIVQLKGGSNDYFVVGTIKAQALRRFQNSCPSPKDPKYKPLPTGFKMSASRKALARPEQISLPVLRYISHESNDVVVHSGAGTPIVKIPLPAFKTKERVLNELSRLIKNKQITKAMLNEFLIYCHDCVGISV